MMVRGQLGSGNRVGLLQRTGQVDRTTRSTAAIGPLAIAPCVTRHVKKSSGSVVWVRHPDRSAREPLVVDRDITLGIDASARAGCQLDSGNRPEGSRIGQAIDRICRPVVLVHAALVALRLSCSWGPYAASCVIATTAWRGPGSLATRSSRSSRSSHAGNAVRSRPELSRYDVRAVAPLPPSFAKQPARRRRLGVSRWRRPPTSVRIGSSN
jgi:hypothetical protein